MKDYLTLIGGATVLCVLVFSIWLIIDGIKLLIHHLKENYRIKHRFDKPPTAKCYCVDCKYYDIETGRCYGFHEDSNRLVGDNMFCYRAEPRKE